MVLGTGATPTWAATGYGWSTFITNDTSTGYAAFNSQGNDFRFKVDYASTAGVTGGTPTNGYMLISGPNASSNIASYFANLGFISNATGYQATVIGTGQIAAATYTSARFSFSSGNITSGTISVYGIANGSAVGNAGVTSWGMFTVSGGTYTLQQSFNVSGISKFGNGLLDVTLQTPYGSNYYSCTAGITSTGNEFWQTEILNQVSGSFRMAMADSSGGATLADPAAGSFICIGYQ